MARTAGTLYISRRFCCYELAIGVCFAQTPGRVEPALAGAIDEDPVSIGVEQDRLTPKIGLINWIADEAKPLVLKASHGTVHVVNLEMKTGLACNRRRTLSAVKR